MPIHIQVTLQHAPYPLCTHLHIYLYFLSFLLTRNLAFHFFILSRSRQSTATIAASTRTEDKLLPIFLPCPALCLLRLTHMC